MSTWVQSALVVFTFPFRCIFSRSLVTSQCIFYTSCVASSVCGKRYFTVPAFTTLITIYSVCSDNRDRSPSCPFHYYLSTIKCAFIVNRPQTPLRKPHPDVASSLLLSVMYTPDSNHLIDFNVRHQIRLDQIPDFASLLVYAYPIILYSLNFFCGSVGMDGGLGWWSGRDWVLKKVVSACKRSQVQEC